MEKSEKGQSAKALYAQILAEIRASILSGERVAGARLPTEFELAEHYHISRGTVRQALGVLVNEGLLERMQGKGTFVSALPLPHEVRTAMPQSGQKSVGVILSESSDELSLDILLGVEQAVKPRGYQISFAYAEENAQMLAQDIARLRASTAGLVILPISDAPYNDEIARLKQDKFPFVLVDRYIPELDCDYVTSDNLGGGYRATEHLLILGHTRIGFVYAGEHGMLVTSVQDRLAGYRKALQEYNLPYDESLIYCRVPEVSGASNIYDAIMRSPDRPDAIFAVNDLVALNLLHAAQRHGVRVPEELALVGFDNVSYSQHLSVPLTTVAQQRTEMGVRAGTLLVNQIESVVAAAPRRIVLPTSLLVRQSCGARLRISSAIAGDEGG